LRDPALAEIRKWAIEDFVNYLIFYMPTPAGVGIVRVLHRSRDWRQLLGLVE
jgi:plasmid stabilization system protein ParE